MLNYIWGFLVVISIVCGVATGKIDGVTNALFDGANGAVTTVLSFSGAVVMWCGMLKIAEKSGLTRVFAKLIRPLRACFFRILTKIRLRLRQFP